MKGVLPADEIAALPAGWLCWRRAGDVVMVSLEFGHLPGRLRRGRGSAEQLGDGRRCGVGLLVHQADGRNRGGHPGKVGQRICRLSDQVQAVCAENRECLSGRNRFDPDGARFGNGLSGFCELVVSAQEHRDQRPRRQAMARVGVEVGDRKQACLSWLGLRRKGRRKLVVAAGLDRNRPGESAHQALVSVDGDLLVVEQIEAAVDEMGGQSGLAGARFAEQ